MKKAMEQHDHSKTSFCPNCGEVVSWERNEQDPNLNKVPCFVCAPLLAKFIDADMKEQLADIDLQDLVGNDLTPPARGSATSIARKEQSEAQAEKRVALKKLRERRTEIAVTRYSMARQN